MLAAGALHLWLYFDYFHRVHVIGVLFLLNAGTAGVIGITLLLSPHPLAAAAGVAYAGATLTGFFLSVFVGLFGFNESLTGAYQEAAGALEVAAIVVLSPVIIATWLAPPRTFRHTGSHRSFPWTVGAVLNKRRS